MEPVRESILRREALTAASVPARATLMLWLRRRRRRASIFATVFETRLSHVCISRRLIAALHKPRLYLAFTERDVQCVRCPLVLWLDPGWMDVRLCVVSGVSVTSVLFSYIRSSAARNSGSLGRDTDQVL